MTDDCLPIVIRGFTKQDTGLLFSSYFETLARERVLPFRTPDIRKAAAKNFDDHLVGPRTAILIACNPEVEEQVFGWVCVGIQRDCVHFLYVREPYRGQGIALRLLTAAKVDTSKPIVATCWTKACETAPVVYRPRLTWRKP